MTLNSIGDAVVSTDIAGNVTFLNPIARAMTGWSGLKERSAGRSKKYSRIVDVANGTRVVNPMMLVIQNNEPAKLPLGCKLVRRDGAECAVEDSAAPIHDRRGSVTGAVMVFHDVTQAQAVSAKMSHLARHDYLTDLPNRLLLNDRQLSRRNDLPWQPEQHRQKLAVLCIDLDRFKHVNDSLGQKVGDKLLLSVAGRMVDSVQSTDTVSRQGGDEFVILLSSITRAEDAELITQKILTVVGMPHQFEEHSLEITASAGIGIYPDDGTDAESLVKSADIAMLNAKNSGRNNYQFFKANMNEHALERQSLESGLRHALDQREFELHYQGKVDLVTERLTGAEALIRWHPPGGRVALPQRLRRLRNNPATSSQLAAGCCGRRHACKNGPGSTPSSHPSLSPSTYLPWSCAQNSSSNMFAPFWRRPGWKHPISSSN